MKPVYLDSSIPEKAAKINFHFPENLMMENASAALEKKVLEIVESRNFTNPKILILCGNGNNGGDGLALSRRLFDRFAVDVFLVSEPKTEEAKTQFIMAKAIGVPFISKICWNDYDLIADCIFGTGFHGEFSDEINQLMKSANMAKAVKLACDIPSGIAKDGTNCENSFKADFTVTMGALKLSLFSDTAKNLCGEITVADLGIQSSIFQKQAEPDAFLLEDKDIKLPLRNNKASHKGSYGHTVVYAGEKSGAAILSASAAMKIGSGLTSLMKTPESNLNQFKISPSLMITEKLPVKTTAIVIGNGLGTPSSQIISDFIKWFKETKNPACVLDADLFSYDHLYDLLDELISVPFGRIVLTPHPKEFANLLNLLKIDDRFDYTVREVLNNRIELGKKICRKFPQIILVLKSANTFIVTSNNIYICDSGTPALSKGGSGDVLAGIIGGLLAQGYSAEDAAITGCYLHGKASLKMPLSGQDFSLSPEDLINLL